MLGDEPEKGIDGWLWRGKDFEKRKTRVENATRNVNNRYRSDPDNGEELDDDDAPASPHART